MKVEGRYELRWLASGVGVSSGGEGKKENEVKRQGFGYLYIIELRLCIPLQIGVLTRGNVICNASQWVLAVPMECFSNTERSLQLHQIWGTDIYLRLS